MFPASSPIAALLPSGQPLLASSPIAAPLPSVLSRASLSAPGMISVSTLPLYDSPLYVLQRLLSLILPPQASISARKKYVPCVRCFLIEEENRASTR
jgi:hypothetical protein